MFEACATFQGARPGACFKLGPKGLGYYLDPIQTMIPEVRPKLPENWRQVKLREERLRVDPQAGAGLSLEYSEFGFAVEQVEPHPGQRVQPGEVIVAIEGRILAGLSAPQMQASFVKRRADGAVLHVASLAEAKDLSKRDPNIVECWDPVKQHNFYFHKKTGRSAWTREELEEMVTAAAAAVQEEEENKPTAPVDLAHFLTHGFAKPKEEKVVKKRKPKPEDKQTEDDFARTERRRWAEWNEGSRGGYTEQFFERYKGSQAFPAKPKPDKRLKGSVGPGQGMEYMARWTGSKNSHN